jgi:hypothetical protein
VRSELEARVRAIAVELDLSTVTSLPRIRATPGDRRVGVVIRASRPKIDRYGLDFLADTYASELVAWELGPRQRAIQERYRFLSSLLAEVPEGSPARAELSARVERLRTHVVTDAQYVGAHVQLVQAPAPVRAGLTGLALGLLLASVVALALETLDRPGRARVAPTVARRG